VTRPLTRVKPDAGLKPKRSNFRWVICSLVFFATTINYLDRAVISLLKGHLETEFHWTETDYGNIVAAFQIAYAAGLLVMGKVLDMVGTRLGYALSIFLWSVAAVAHALVSSTLGFIIARSALGITESGNFPAAIKTVAEWFPKKERALAAGLLNSGTNIGAIAAPLTVPFIVIHLGWQWAFIITGSIGFVWLIVWLAVYDIPARHSRVSVAELDYINSDKEFGEVGVEKGQAQSWIRLLSYKSTWGFALGKFLTDPAWWFYLFWLPAFLKAQYNLEGTRIVLPVAIVYTLSSFGSVLGGWLPLVLIRNGLQVGVARRLSMLLYAVCAVPVIFAQLAGSYNLWLAILIIGFAAAAHQAWSANMYTTVSDYFPKTAVGSVIGIGGMAGAAGGILAAKLTGPLFDHFKALGKLTTGYYIVFLIFGFSYLLAWGLMRLFDRKNPDPTKYTRNGLNI